MMPMRICIKFLLIISCLVVGNIAIAKSTVDSDQLDEQDRQEFNLRIERANACTRSRDFVCAEQQLGQAKGYVNGSHDRTVLQKAMENLELQRQLAVRDDAKQKYAGQRELVEANAESTERELAAARRQDIAAANEAARRADMERERRQSAPQPQGNLIDEINKTAAKNMAVLDTINRQTKEAYADSNRVLAAQAADRKREADERAAQRRRDDELNRNTRVASAEAQRERDQQAVREQEQKRQREAEAAAAKQAKEQEQARLQEERRQQEAKAAADKRAEQKRQADYLAALRQGIRLRATKCMGGEGKYYVTGSMPGIKKELSCVDVYYEASCPGSAASSRGVITTFVPGGCLSGDAVTIDPKPACAVEQVRVEVSDVRAGCK